PPMVTVVATNARARNAGIEPGMTELQAQQRLQVGCEPKRWHIRQRSLDQEKAATAALLDCAGAFSPRVEATSPDTVVADIAGLEPLFGVPGTIARNLARRCSDAGLEVNVAVASNPDTAVHAARGYAGITVIAPGKEAERLGPLPLDVLRAPQYGRAANKGDRQSITKELEMLDTLERWGVRTFRALTALPEIAVVERLGQPGLRWRHFALGTARRELVISEAPLEFEEVCELEYPVDLLEPLAFLLARMLDQLCARLQSRALACHELRLKMQLDPDVTVDREGMPVEPSVSEIPPFPKEGNDGAPDPTGNSKPETGNFLERTLKLPVPMLDSKTFLKLLQLDLKANPPTAPVLKLWLHAEPVRPKFDQRGLFLPLTPEPQKLEITLARLAGVTGGPGNVGSPELLDTHRPDSFRMKRFTPPLANHAGNNGDDVLRKPMSALRRFRPPQPVSVQIINGHPGTIGPPRALADKDEMARAVYGEVVWCAGPWRTSGEWWNQEPWEREEWDIAIEVSGFKFPVSSSSAARIGSTGNWKLETGNSPLYRLYRDLLEGTWFVEGEYD
ncbi:MAG: DNA polymerase Y family protein, partial [Terriglobales bacterium]